MVRSRPPHAELPPDVEPPHLDVQMRSRPPLSAVYPRDTVLPRSSARQ